MQKSTSSFPRAWGHGRGGLSAPPKPPKWACGEVLGESWTTGWSSQRDDAGGGRAELHVLRSKSVAAAKPHKGDCSQETCDIGIPGTSHRLSHLGQNKGKPVERHL